MGPPEHDVSLADLDTVTEPGSVEAVVTAVDAVSESPTSLAPSPIVRSGPVTLLWQKSGDWSYLANSFDIPFASYSCTP